MNSPNSSAEHFSGNISSIDHRLADAAKPRSVSSASSAFPASGIDVDAMKSSSAATFVRHEAGREARPVQAPGHQADRDQVPAVVLRIAATSSLRSSAGRSRAARGPAWSSVMYCTKCLPAERPGPASRVLSACRRARPARSSGRSRRSAGLSAQRRRPPPRTGPAPPSGPLLEFIVPRGTSCLW